MKETLRKFEPRVAYNPNILQHMGERSAQEFLEGTHLNTWRIEHDVEEKLDAGKMPTSIPNKINPPKPFARVFEQRYQEALRLVQKVDTKGVLSKTYGLVPLAPRLDWFLGAEVPDVLNKPKFGGIPDFRGSYGIVHRERRKGSLEDSIKDVWPKDADGNRMQFVAQIDLAGEIHAAIDYFSHHVISEYDDRIGVFNNGRGSVSMAFGGQWPLRLLFFRAWQGDFSSRLDTHLVILNVYDDDESKLPTEEEYIQAVQKVIPERVMPAHEDSFTWQNTSRPITGMSLGFDLDFLPSWSRWEDGSGAVHLPKSAQTLEDKLRDLEGVFDTPHADVLHMLGAPRSQQTEKRFFDIRGKRMRPMLHWHNENHDFDHQLNFGRKDYEGNFWGKEDGSCT